MKQYSKWLVVTIAAVSTVAIVSSAQAQYVTGTPYLSNMDPSTFNTPPNAVYPSWDTATFTDGATGLEVQNSGSSGFGSMYYVIPAGDVQYPLNTGDNSAVLTLTFNSLNSVAGAVPDWIGIYFTLGDNAGTTANLGGYGGSGNPGNPANWVWNGSVLTITAPLPAAQISAIQAAGGDAIYSFNLGIDPSPLASPYGYDVTFNSLELVPEPASLALLGLGMAGLLVFRRRK